jgi:hypothetical protein
MSKQYRIAISGKANTGKDTTANMLAVSELAWKYDLYSFEERFAFRSGFGVSELAWKYDLYSYEKLAFANPIKEIISTMFPSLDREYLFGSSEHRNKIITISQETGQPITIRQLLQDIGERCKSIDPMIWINALDYSISQNKDRKLIIVSDLRFIDEYKYLKNNGFFIIRIIKNTDQNMTHISETQQECLTDDKFDYTINNNGSINELNENVSKIVEILMQ